MSRSDPSVSISVSPDNAHDDFRAFTPLSAPRIRVLFGGETVIDERWRYQLRAPYWRLYCNLNDGAWLDTGRRRFLLKTGHSVVIPSWCDLRSGCRGRVGHRFLHFEVLGVEGALAGLGLNQAIDLGPDGSIQAQWTGWVGAMDQFAGIFSGMAACSLAMAQVVGGLNAATQQRMSEDHAARDPLGPALRMIAADYASKLSVPQMAAACAMAVDSFARLFRQHLGLPPAAWLRRQRCARLAEYLELTDDSLDHLAERCGFANRFHATRVFTQVMNCAPGAWRLRSRHALSVTRGGR